MGHIRLQIQIAGAPRTGKTTLARNIQKRLQELEHRCVVVDVDETRTRVFRNDEPPLGSQLQKLMQSWTYNAVFGLRIPDILAGGGVPIFAATHAHPESYGRAESVARDMNSELRFIILETTTFEEMARRCRDDGESHSDMHDPVAHPAERENWEDISSRIRSAYGPDFKKPCLRLTQGTPEEMAETTLRYILSTNVDKQL